MQCHSLPNSPYVFSCPVHRALTFYCFHCFIGALSGAQRFNFSYTGFFDSLDTHHTYTQIGKFAECAGDLSCIQISCAAVFVSLNNSSIVSFCCLTKISRLEPRLKFKVRGREIGRARQTFQSGLIQFLYRLMAFNKTLQGPHR